MHKKRRKKIHLENILHSKLNFSTFPLAFPLPFNFLYRIHLIWGQILDSPYLGAAQMQFGIEAPPSIPMVTHCLNGARCRWSHGQSTPYHPAALPRQEGECVLHQLLGWWRYCFSVCPELWYLSSRALIQTSLMALERLPLTSVGFVSGLY